MKRIRKFLFSESGMIHLMVSGARRHSVVASFAILISAVMLTSGAAQSQSQGPYKFSLVPASDAIKTCLPHAAATVMVFPKGDLHGVDTLELNAEGLPPNTAFTVFLTELPNFPFGASQYIAEFTTNAQGRGSVRVDSIIEEAFALTGGVPGRKELNHIVVWFADPAGDDVCFGTGGGPVTPFDGDGTAGGTVLSSTNFLPGAPLP